MDVDVQEPEVVLEVMFTVPSAQGTHTHDKTDITDDASGYVASLVRVEVNTARTVCLKHHCAILLATTRVDAPIVISQQSSQRIRVIAEECLTDFLERPEEVFGSGHGHSSGAPVAASRQVLTRGRSPVPRRPTGAARVRQ